MRARPSRRTASALRSVLRVHTPEPDMHPILRPRGRLLTPPQAPAVSSAPRVSCALSQSVRHAALRNDLRLLTDISRPAHSPLNLRLIALTAVRHAIHIHPVMNALSDMLHRLSHRDMTPLFSLLIKRYLASGMASDGFRGERISRALDVPLSRGTYARLMREADGLEVVMALFHRAVSVGYSPTTGMLNRLLEVLLKERQLQRAHNVLSLLHATRLFNAPTLKAILTHLPADTATLDSLRELIQPYMSPPMADVIVLEYLKLDIDATFLAIERFHSNHVLISPYILDRLIVACVKSGRLEAALTAWRERRRGWAGNPRRYARRCLWRQLWKRGTDRDLYLMRLLEEDVSDAELARMRRGLAVSLEVGWEILKDDHTHVKDRLWVLYSWVEQGFQSDVKSFIANLESVDLRMLAVLLKCGQDGRQLFVDGLIKVDMDREKLVPAAARMLGLERGHVEQMLHPD